MDTGRTREAQRRQQPELGSNKVSWSCEAAMLDTAPPCYLIFIQTAMNFFWYFAHSSLLRLYIFRCAHVFWSCVFITLLAFFFFFQCSFFTFIWQHFDFTLPLYKYSALGPCHAACFDVQRCWISKPEGETCQNKYTQDERKDISSVNFLMIKLNYFGHYGGFLSLQAIFLGWTWKEWYCTLKYQLST